MVVEWSARLARKRALRVLHLLAALSMMYILLLSLENFEYFLLKKSGRRREKISKKSKIVLKIINRKYTTNAKDYRNILDYKRALK